MNKFKTLFFVLLLVVLNTSCGDPDVYCDEGLECAITANIKIISEEEKLTTSSYYELYCYQNKMYTVYYCPMCFIYFVSIAVDCNETILCEPHEDCMEVFFEEADYQYTFIID